MLNNDLIFIDIFTEDLVEDVVQVRKLACETILEHLGDHWCSRDGGACDDNTCAYFDARVQCPANCGPNCLNQAKWKSVSSELMEGPVYYNKLGCGVRAKEDIPAGTFLIEYVGTLRKNEDFSAKDKSGFNPYGMVYDDGAILVIDAQDAGNICKNTFKKT